MRVPQEYKDQINSTFSENALTMMQKRYLLSYDKEGREKPADMFERVASALAEVERQYGKTEEWTERIAKDFFEIMARKEYTPAGRTLTNAGGETPLIANCIVLRIEDSMESIFQTLKEAALLQQAGCGLGFDLSEMRPAMSPTKKSRGQASGPVSFLKVYDAAFATIKQQSRHGANMAMMRVDHPDILDFIRCKEVEGEIRNFNVSVTVTDEFMEALEKSPNERWYCQFNGKKMKPHDVLRHPNGSVYDFTEVDITVKELFDALVEHAWLNGEPGIAFIDTINRTNPLPGLGPIAASNPCVTGDTLVATEKGLVRMEKLVRQYNKGGLKILTDQRVPRPVPMKMSETISIGTGALQQQIPLLSLGYFAPADDQGVELRDTSRAFKTGVKEVVKIVIQEGYELVATPDHKVLTTEGWVEAKDSLGKEILIQSAEGCFNENPNLPFEVKNKVKGENGHVYIYNFPTKWSKELGQILGFLVGDGWLRDTPEQYAVGITFARDEHKLMNYCKEILDAWYGKVIASAWERDNGVTHLLYQAKNCVEYFKKLGVKPVRAEEKKVPETLWQAPREAVIGFLQGIFTADGTVRDNPKSNSSWVALTAKSKKLLKDVQILLLNLGIRSTIFDRSRPARGGMFPYVTKAGKKLSYTTDGVCYELAICGEGRERFRELVGFLNPVKQARLENVRFKRFYKQKFTARVIELQKLGKRTVYDLTEPLTHSMICNGLVVHQCGEQFLHPYDNCNLGSINLARFVKNGAIEWNRLRFVTRTAVRLMDNVIDKFDFPVPQVTELARKNRRIGLGIMGFADMLYQLRVRYDSPEGMRKAEEVMEFITREAHQMSEELGQEKGEFPNTDKSIFPAQGIKRRNAALTTVAPTGSISMMFDCSSGIEPNFALAYVKQDKDGQQYRYFNKYFQEALDKLQLTQEQQKEIMQTVMAKGSIQSIEWLPKEVRDAFVVAMDISGKSHMEMQAAFQRHVDNSISKTINFPNSAAREEVAESFMLAWKLGCKSATVYRDGSRQIQILNVGAGEKIVATTEKPAFRPEKTPQSSRQAIPQNGLVPRKRPEVMAGKTYRMKTGYGNLYITINDDEHGKPFEVFATIGKSGGFFQEQSEAICRLSSLALRAGIRVEEVISDLKGIRGPMPIFTEKGTVLSLPDAIGRVLEDHVSGGREIQDILERPEKQEVFAFAKEGSPSLADFGFMPGCPECGAQLVMSEGCISCKACGFSRCM